jgi:hypothetical protein
MKAAENILIEEDRLLWEKDIKVRVSLRPGDNL